MLPDSDKGYELCLTGDLSTAYVDETLNHDNSIIINHRRYIKTNDFVTIDTIDTNKELFFLSRSHRLIKRYGQLINLDHIEYILKKSFTSLNFISFSDEEWNNQIYLIVTSLRDETLLNQIQECLKKYLPKYMHPSQYIFTQEVPQNSSGKINYFLIKKNFIPKQDQQITQYFQRFFQNGPFNKNKLIVDLGLESIDYLELAEHFLKITGKWLDVAKITDKTRIADIDSCLVAFKLGSPPANNRVTINPIQKKSYSYELDNNTDLSFCFIVSLCLKGNIDVQRLEFAIAETLTNHFILNSKLEWNKDHCAFVSAEIQPSFTLNPPIFFSKNQQRQLKTYVHSERLVRIYLQKKKNQYFLIMAYHHIALDGWSAVLVREELFRRYEGTQHIKCLNQKAEIDSLNKANEFWLHNSSTVRELKSRICAINPFDYNHIGSIFNDRIQIKHSCFTLEKKHVDDFARKNQIDTFPYSVLFALLFHHIIAQLAGVSKLFFYVSCSNRNIPVPDIKELITNLATCLPIFLDNKNLSAKEFAVQIKENLSSCFKNMSYSGQQELWNDEVISSTLTSSEERRYQLAYTYINKITDRECIQNKYIDWDHSTNVINPIDNNPYRKKKIVFFRVYNMGSLFVILLNSQMKKKLHDCFIKKVEELMDLPL